MTEREFVLRSTTREWTYKAITVKNFPDGSSNIKVGERNEGVSITRDVVEALVRLWEQELKPCEIEWATEPAAYCSRIITTRPDHHMCHEPEIHCKPHRCPCGFEWT